MKWISALLPSLTAKLRRMIRREIQRDFQHNLVTYAAARQSFDLYEMKLETLDTRLAKRMLALEARIDDLEAQVGRAGERPVPGRATPARAHRAG